MDYYQFPSIYAKESKDIPDWLKAGHDWQNATPVDKLPKNQLKVKMCCSKCEEKVIEEIREVHGVFDVRAERFASKVVVVAMPTPHGLDEHEVLRRAKKVDKKAKFVELDDKEKLKPKDDDKKKKEEEEKKKKAAAEEQKRKDQEKYVPNIFTWNPPLGQWAGGPYYAPQPMPYYPGLSIGQLFLRQKEEEEKKEKEEEKKKKEAEEKKKLEADIHAWKPVDHWGGPYFVPQPYFTYNPEESREFRPSQWYAPHFHSPPLPFQPENEYSRPYFYYH